MKIPVDTLSFEEQGYTTEKDEPLWLTLPRSVLEGYVYRIQQLSRSLGDQPTPDQTRELSITVLELVRSWNFDDEDGAPLPTLRSVADSEEERARIVAQVPMEVINAIVEKVTGGATEVDKSSP